MIHSSLAKPDCYDRDNNRGKQNWLNFIFQFRQDSVIPGDGGLGVKSTVPGLLIRPPP